MFEHWISPPRIPPHEAFGLAPHTFGRKLNISLDPGTKNRILGFVGLDTKWADRVRRHLYRFSSGSTHDAMCDLGDFRKQQPEFVLHALRALIEAKICPVVIGSTPALNNVAPQMLPADARTRSVCVVLHETVPDWVIGTRENIQTHVLGVQQHILNPELAGRAETAGAEIRRLGMLRDNLEDAEPEVRDARILTLDLSSVRVSDLPAQAFRSTSGFSTEEACRLMRYSGQATGLEAVLVSGHDPRSVDFEVSANTTAQLLWYFADAFHHAVVEKPTASTQFQRYVLHLDDYNLDLVFYKSHRTGRWWVEVPAGADAITFACAHHDYQRVCEGKVSERILRSVRQSLQHCEQAL